MAKIEQIAQSFLGQAAANPGQKHEICRQAAHVFMGLAHDPGNARASNQLAEVGLTFARAAMEGRPPVMDDFADLLKETQVAYEQAGPWGDDHMDLIARRREIHDERTPFNPGQVFITPESFNKDVTLGRSQKIKWQPTDDEKRNNIQQNQTVAFWQGVKKEAQAMTIDVNLLFPPQITDPDLIVASSARPFAEIESGSDGNINKFRCDVAFGKRITVVGNYISVSVGMGAPGFGAPSPILTAGASIGAFAAPSPSPTILTEYVDALVSGGSGDLIPIPMKAVMLLPLQMSLPLGGTAEVEFLDYGGLLIGRSFYVQSVAASTQAVPITGDAAYVRVNNTTAVFAANFRLPFQLAV